MIFAIIASSMRIAMIGQKGIRTGGRGGGVERHVEEIGKRLVTISHNDVFIYARRRMMPDQGNTIAGMHIVYIPTLYRKNIEAIFHTLLSTLHALFGSYDIIHYHGVGPATLAWIPRLLLRHTRVVVTFHSQDRFHAKWSLFARWYLYFGEWSAVRFPHLCIVVSHTLQVFCRRRFGREAVYIPSGAQVREVQATNRLEDFGLEKGNYLLTAGRIVEHKGLHHLIDAYLRLEEEQGRGTLPKLVFVGAPSFTDDYLLRLKQQASGHPRILFLGFQQGEALEQIFAHALLYVHPSEAEGLPLVILEAMSYGLPVLVSDIPENIETMSGRPSGGVERERIGMQFQVGNVDDLTKQLQFALSHPKELHQNGLRLKEIIRTQFDWNTIAEQTEEAYRTIRH